MTAQFIFSGAAPWIQAASFKVVAKGCSSKRLEITTIIGCVTGPTQTSFSTSIPSMATTSIANDLRIRVFGAESGGAGMTIDLATVGGSTAYQALTLYPVTFRDAADTTPEVIPWGLALP